MRVTAVERKTKEKDTFTNLIATQPTEEPLKSKIQKEDDIFIHIKGNETKVQYRYDGRLNTKIIALNDLASVMNSNLTLDTGILEVSGSDYCGVRQYIKTGSYELIVHEINNGRRIMNHIEGSGTIGWPRLVSFSLFRDNRLSDTHIYASKYPIVNPTVELYRFPFGNVHDDYRVCWGGVSTTNFTKNEVLHRFMLSTFNNDLDRYYNYGNGGIRDFIRTGRDIDLNLLRSAGSYNSALETEKRRMRVNR